MIGNFSNFVVDIFSLFSSEIRMVQKIQSTMDGQNLPTIESNNDIRTFAEQMLMDRIFMGDYQEKRYVNKLNAYKDLIVINKHEKILCDDLTSVKNRILSENPIAWIGFTEPTDVGVPAIYCIWTTLDDVTKMQRSNIATNSASVGFGEYWFQVKAIRFGLNAMEIQVSILRPIDPTSAMSSGPSISTLAQQAFDVDTAKIQQYVQENIVEVNWMELFKQWRTSFNEMAYRFVSTEITWSNFIHCIHVLGLLTITFSKWSMQFIHSTGQFTLRLIFELNRLIKAATPIILAIVSLMTKMIGGLYLLLAMIWRDFFDGNSQSQKNPSVPRPNVGQPYGERASITYRQYPRTFPKATYKR